MVVWSADNGNLCDYKTLKLPQNNNLKKSCFLVNRDGHYYLTSLSLKPEEELIFTLLIPPVGLPKVIPNQKSSNCYVFINPVSFPNGLLLREGTKFKLGRANFKVTSIQFSPIEAKTERKLDNEYLLINKEIRQCKICLESSCESDDFFVSPCSCKGSLQYIHYKCLKMRFPSKKHTEQCSLNKNEKRSFIRSGEA